jgi:DNA primase
VTTPEGKDPDEFIKTHGAETYKKLILNAPLLIDYEINSIIKKGEAAKSPQEKSDIIKEILPVLTEIRNEIIKAEYLKTVSRSLDISENALNTELKNI